MIKVRFAGSINRCKVVIKAKKKLFKGLRAKEGERPGPARDSSAWRISSWLPVWWEE